MHVALTIYETKPPLTCVLEVKVGHTAYFNDSSKLVGGRLIKI